MKIGYARSLNPDELSHQVEVLQNLCDRVFCEDVSNYYRFTSLAQLVLSLQLDDELVIYNSATLRMKSRDFIHLQTHIKRFEVSIINLKRNYDVLVRMNNVIPFRKLSR